MRSQGLMFYGWIAAVGTVISLTFAGAWLGTSEVVLANSVSTFKQANILGIWSITVPNINFFLVGARALSSFDFAFFSGGMQVVQWFLFLTLGLGMIWMFYEVMISAFQGLFGRR